LIIFTESLKRQAYRCTTPLLKVRDKINIVPHLKQSHLAIRAQFLHFWSIPKQHKIDMNANKVDRQEDQLRHRKLKIVSLADTSVRMPVLRILRKSSIRNNTTVDSALSLFLTSYPKLDNDSCKCKGDKELKPNNERRQP
jgi:hypothetical protein